MKKTAATSTLILGFLITALAGAFFVNSVWANPWASPLFNHSIIEGVIPLPEGTKLPVVTVFNPQNSTAYASKDVLLNFNVTIDNSNNVSLSVDEVYYVVSWQNVRGGHRNITAVDVGSADYTGNDSYTSYAFSVNLTGVPEGPRWIQVYARSGASAYQTGYHVNGFHRTTYYVAYEKALSSSKVEFTIDTSTPQIVSLSLEDEMYDAADVPLVLTTNEPVAQVAYSLDGQTNVTAAGNTTLTGVPNGSHNITVYAWDEAGNACSSETVAFSVDEPERFPILPVTASVATVAIVSASITLYFKKRKH